MTVDIAFANILVYMLVWVRLAGMLLFNPLLARRSIPAAARMGLVLFLALMIAPMQSAATVAAVYAMSGGGYVLAVVGELMLGLVYGFIFQIFYYLLFFVGDMIDSDMGLAMAKTFDPATSIQTSFSSSVVTIFFSLYFFATGSHLLLIHLFADSFSAIAPGAFTLSRSVLSFAVRLFGTVFSLAVRLWAPYMVAEFVLQAGMGILMKFIPQITVFVINFQLRILLGLLLLLLFAPFVADFIGGYTDTLFDSLYGAAGLAAGGPAAGG